MADSLPTGFSLVVRNIHSGIEGGFGLGFVLGTNLTLDVQTQFGGAVARNTPYSLSYTDPADNSVKTLSLLHDPAIPYQARLPFSTLITLDIPDSSLYVGQVLTFTIDPNTSRVVRPRLVFKNAYARATLRFYF